MALAGVGVQFRRWNSGTGSWDSLAEVNSIDGPGMTRDFIDTTALDTVGGYRTYIAGFRDAADNGRHRGLAVEVVDRNRGPVRGHQLGGEIDQERLGIATGQSAIALQSGNCAQGPRATG